MNQETVAEEKMNQVSAEVCVAAICRQFASRGLVRSAMLGAKEQISAEEETRKLAPSAYRLSLLPGTTVKDIYCRGKEHMTGEDLLRYARESKRISDRETPAEETVSVYQSADPLSNGYQEETALVRQEKKEKTFRWKALPERVGTAVRKKIPQWFHSEPSEAVEPASEKKKFPLSAFAAIAAVAVSMMLIVSSALMVTNAETKISELNSSIAQLNGEIRDLEKNLTSGCDLMEIRRVATEELGMVEEEYIKTEYITMDSEEKVESFDRDDNRFIGLSAILSAMGWKK